jgi:hypothetical protein
MTISVFSKAHMEQVLAQAKVKITPASKSGTLNVHTRSVSPLRCRKTKVFTLPLEACSLADLLPAFAPAKGRRGKRKDTGASSGAEEVESEPEPPAPKKPRPQPQRKSKRLTREPEPAHPPTTKEWKPTHIQISSQTSRMRKRKEEKEDDDELSKMSRKHQSHAEDRIVTKQGSFTNYIQPQSVEEEVSSGRGGR